MADNQSTTTTILDLDNDAFVSKLKEAMGLLSDFGSGEGMSGLSDALVGIGETVGIAAVAFGAFKAAIDLTVEGEKIDQINKSFETLAATFGVNGEQMKADLLKVSDGLISETDLLQAANKAIVQMGDSANRLPEIMELARKATSVFGGDLTTNFENLARAISSGNTRMLKNYGIVVDTTKAQDDYARSLGVGREALDATGQRLAVLNAALEQGKEKFAGINTEATPTINNLQRIKVSFSEIGEMAAVAWNKVAGPTVSHVIQNVSDTIHGWAIAFKAAFGSGKEQADAQKESLERQIADTKTAIDLYKQLGEKTLLEQKTMELQKQEAELAKLNHGQAESNKLKQDQIAIDKQAAVARAPADVGIDQEKVLKERQKLDQQLAQLDKALADDQIKNETDVNKVETDQAQKKVAIERAAAEQIKKIRTDAAMFGLQNTETVTRAIEDIQKKAILDVKAIDLQTDQERLKALKNLEIQNEQTVKGIEAGWQKMGEQSRQNFKNMSRAGEMAFNEVGSQAVAAFKAVGDGSKSASQAMAGFFFGALGGMAEKQGEVMVLAGLWPLNPVVIAAGGALIALGAAISSLGSGGSSSSSGGGGGGLSAASTGGASPVSAQAGSVGNLQPQAKQGANVQLVINGNYFETDQTKQALMQMMRAAQDQTDYSLKNIGTP